MFSEVELKLVLSQSAADAFLDSGLLEGAPLAQNLQATYFDTPDHVLLGADYALRIRRAGQERIQTIKRADPSGAGLFARSEWERSVRGDLPVLDETTPVSALLGAAVTRIVPVFEVNVERLIWLVEDEAAAIELVLDRGAAIAAERQSTVCEIELELKRGAPSALFALGRKVTEAFPARLGVVTKAERGYALVGPIRTAFKAEPIRLDEAASSATAFQAIAGLCVRQYRLNETLLLRASQPEALHQARVSLRRLRSALAIFKPLLAGEQVQIFQSELRWLTAILGEARDIDVLADTVRDGPLKARLLAAREQAYVNVGAALDSSRVRDLLFDLTEWLACGDWLSAPESQASRDLPAREFATNTLHTLRRRVKRRGAALDTLDDEQRHDVRKAVKRLRYGAEFFEAFFSSGKQARRYRKFVASLEQLQDEVGALNDMVAAPQLLERLNLLDQEGAKAILHHGERSKILAASKEAHADLVDRKNFWK